MTSVDALARDGLTRDDLCLGTVGSMIVACTRCGEEHFRESTQPPEYESCFSCPDGGDMKRMLRRDLDAVWRPLWRTLGWKIKGEDY